MNIYELSRINVPGKLLYITNEDSVGTVVDFKKHSSLERARNSHTISRIDKFTGVHTVTFPTETLIENDGVSLEMLDTTRESPRSGKIRVIDCLVTDKYNRTCKISVESDRLLQMLRHGTLSDGKYGEKILLGTLNGLVYTLTKSEYEQVQKHKGSVKKESMTTVHKVGGVYRTPSYQTVEVYLGECYQHIKQTSYMSFEWLDEPVKQYVFFSIGGWGTFGFRTSGFKNYTLDDFYKYLEQNDVYTHYPHNTKMYRPLSIQTLVSAKETRVPRVDCEYTVPYNGHGSIEDLIGRCKSWMNNTDPKEIGNLFHRDIAFIFGISTSPDKVELTAEMREKLLGLLKTHAVLKYNGEDYSGKLEK